MPVATGPRCTAPPAPGLRKKLPHVNTAVANSTSHGTSRANTAGDVWSSSSPPAAPPAMLSTNSAQNGRPPAPDTSLRPAYPDVICAGNSATVDVMLAASGDIPDTISAG